MTIAVMRYGQAFTNKCWALHLLNKEIPKPMLTNAEIIHMSNADKIGEAIRRGLPYVPSEARSFVNSLLQPLNLTIIAGTLVVWAGSHAFGVGEIVDVILLSAGVISVGFSVFDGARELYDFAVDALHAHSDGDFEKAGWHFSRAVTLLGVSALQAVLLRGRGEAVKARPEPLKNKGRVNMGDMPLAGNQLRLSRPAQLPNNSFGITDEYGVIQVARNHPLTGQQRTLTEQRKTLFHELAHRYFTPRTGPLRKLRAEASISLYSRSALLRYLEEALAEGYGRLKIYGLAEALGAYRFPIRGHYMTVSQIAGEGLAIGTIMLGGTLFYVSISLMPTPDSQP